MFKALDRWPTTALPLESAAEEALVSILDLGPGTEATPLYAQANTWSDAINAVAADPAILERHCLVVVPQAPVGRYRADFLVIAAVSRYGQGAFFVEIDGKIDHVETPDVEADLARECDIRAQTGLPVLRFSGSEVLYARRCVHGVIAAQVEAMEALRNYSDHPVISPEAEMILMQIAWLTTHRSRRLDFTVRNSTRSTAEAYEWSDPLGLDGLPPDLVNEAQFDPHTKLRISIAELRHAIAKAGRVTLEFDVLVDNGDLRPIPFAVVGALRRIRDQWLAAGT